MDINVWRATQAQAQLGAVERSSETPVTSRLSMESQRDSSACRDGAAVVWSSSVGDCCDAATLDCGVCCAGCCTDRDARFPPQVECKGFRLPCDEGCELKPPMASLSKRKLNSTTRAMMVQKPAQPLRFTRLTAFSNPPWASWLLPRTAWRQWQQRPFEKARSGLKQQPRDWSHVASLHEELPVTRQDQQRLPGRYSPWQR
ncbi:hypothetical protein BC567DRAFT_51305 [Phyllosticta citribraziliensis]